MAEHPAKRWLKRLAEPLRPRLRPGLFIIGAQKAGTSALFSMLGSHPRILAPQVKEPHFFNSNKAYAKGMREYLDSFPIRPLRGPAPLTLEATVGYLEHPEAAGRLQRHFPEALLVAVLRDPVDRAFSAWNMFRDFAGHPGREHLVEHRSFEQAIDEELSGTAAERARRYLATGHYARVEQEGERFFLSRGKDPSKDQSYFLYGVARRRLPRLLLPLGGYSKEDVRALAREAALPVAEKSESMEICFAGEGDYRRLLDGRSLPPGLIVDEDGEPLGAHRGIANYTVGQRKGLGISSRDGLHVLRIDPGRNAVIVGPRERAFRRRVRASNVNILFPEPPAEGALLFGKTRSRGEPLPCDLLRMDENVLEVLFHEPQFAPTPGQRLVLYDAGGRVAAGGVIEYSEEAE